MDIMKKKNKPTPLFFSNLCKLIDGDEPEGTPEDRAMARKYYHDHYDDFEHFRLTDYAAAAPENREQEKLKK